MNRIPETLASRFVRPFARFLQIESASGIVLLICTAVALILANSPWPQNVLDWLQTPAGWTFGDWQFIHPVQWWIEVGLVKILINDGLMTIFFFVVGLEIKRELVAGELRDPRKAALPIVAALGGMIVPAMIYLSLLWDQPGEAGWGIPMATDIAFVVGVLALLGTRVPFGLKIMLLSLAIADDLGAIVVIAVFYSSDISLLALGLAAIGFLLIILLRLLGVRRARFYAVIGVGIWFAFLFSGIHPTIAGVLLGFLTPATAWFGDELVVGVIGDVCERLPAEATGPSRAALLEELGVVAREGISPLERLEMKLHPWVAFGIMPLFALANAGVALKLSALDSRVAWGAAAGLVLGKPIGIFLFSAISVLVGIARLPSGVSWGVLLGGGCLGGIGFTMSLFIANLGLHNEPELLEAGKIGTLTGSTLSAVLGCVLLLLVLPRKESQVSTQETGAKPPGEL